MTKTLKIVRLVTGKNSTLSHLYLDDIFLCYLLEDRIAKKKVAGLTCIPEGKYKLVLNTTAGMHQKYAKLFPAMHKGMLQISGIPNFDLVYLHIGNSHHETKGCPLTGRYWQQQGADYSVCQSTVAYQQIYPLLVAALQCGEMRVEVINYVMAYGNKHLSD